MLILKLDFEKVLTRLSMSSFCNFFNQKVLKVNGVLGSSSFLPLLVHLSYLMVFLDLCVVAEGG
jgi:hypothetical protein